MQATKCGRSGPPDQVVPLLLDRSRSPVVAFDTEYKGVPCEAVLNGISFAGGTPGDLFGTFFHFKRGREQWPWERVFREVILPIFNDPDRTVVGHPLKVDMQLLRARGLRDKDVRCRVGCTMSRTHIYDDNLPKGLKDLGFALLNVQDLTTYKQTMKEIEDIRKRAKKEADSLFKRQWALYLKHLRYAKGDPIPPVETWGDLERVVFNLPAGLKKSELKERLWSPAFEAAADRCDARADEVFERYGTDDALLTLGIWYWYENGDPGVMPGLTDEERRLAELETRVCYPIVAMMEEHGLKLDVQTLGETCAAMEKAMAVNEAEVMRLWQPFREGEDFNPNSDGQVADVVWDVWNLRPPPWALSDGAIKPQFSRDKGTRCSTREEVLQYLANHAKKEEHTHALKTLLLHRSFTKMYGTYVHKLLLMAEASPDHRIHASFWPVGARTGRFTSDEPNMQNMPRPYTMPEVEIPAKADPKKPPAGVASYENRDGSYTWRVRSLRDSFIPEKGHLLVSVDLAQIENRIVAHESQDPNLLRLFRGWDCFECKKSGETHLPLHACPECGAPEGKRDKTKPEQPAISGFCLGRDIHSKTSVITGLFAKHGPKEGRQRAKAVNHAFNYGMGANTLAKNEGMTVREAEGFLRALDEEYPRVRGGPGGTVRPNFHDRVRKGIERRGYVQMFDGHKRRFQVPQLLQASGNMRQWEWEKIIREAGNALAQGGAAVIMKTAMIQLEEEFNSHEHTKGCVSLINQVHDELVYETPEWLAEWVEAIVCHALEHAYYLRVPIIAEGNRGKRWGEIH